MVLEAFEGLTDRGATDGPEVDLRWWAGAGVDVGVECLQPTLLVGQRGQPRPACGTPRARPG